MVTFLALYRGPSVQGARLVAVTTDPDIVRAASESQLDSLAPDPDPVLRTLDDARRTALRIILDEAGDASA